MSEGSPRDTGGAARTIFIGDIHGCRDELEELLIRVGFTEGDRVVSVGDVVVRGPDSAGSVALLRRVGALAVRGNHEERVLRLRKRGYPWDLQEWRRMHLSPAGQMTRRAARSLSEADVAWLRALPLWLDFPEHGARVVHAGVVPGVPIERQRPDVLMTIRCLDSRGGPMSERDGTLWGKSYLGPEHVIFGHNALPHPQLHAWATGLDTSCVYGGHLTAMVLKRGQHPPPPASRRDVLVSVPARKAYVPVRL